MLTDKSKSPLTVAIEATRVSRRRGRAMVVVVVEIVADWTMDSGGVL